MIKHSPNNKKVFFEIGSANDKHRTHIRRALHDMGAENRRHTRKLITTGPKTGRIYRKNGSLHQASAPGQAPASQTGALAKSVGFRVRGSEQMEFGDRVLYGKFLEDGTRKMGQRPHLSTTVKERERDNFNSLQRGFKP